MFLLMSGLIKETIDNACHQINQSIEEAQEDYIQYNGVVISTKVFWNYLEEGKLDKGVGGALCGEYNTWCESNKFGSNVSDGKNLFGWTSDGCPV